jgi:hypothetical protein
LRTKTSTGTTGDEPSAHHHDDKSSRVSNAWPPPTGPPNAIGDIVERLDAMQEEIDALRNEAASASAPTRPLPAWGVFPPPISQPLNVQRLAAEVYEQYSYYDAGDIYGTGQYL